MKHYAYLLLIILITASCRSNSHVVQSTDTSHIEERHEQGSSKTDSTTAAAKETTKTKDEVSSNVQNTEETKTEDKKADEYQEEYELTTLYDKDGNVRATKERGRRSGRTESTVSRAGSSHASSGHNKTLENVNTKEELESNSTAVAESDIQTKKTENTSEHIDNTSSSDSRWIQGVEWLYVVGVIAAAAIILLFIRYGKKNRK